MFTPIRLKQTAELQHNMCGKMAAILKMCQRLCFDSRYCLNANQLLSITIIDLQHS